MSRIVPFPSTPDAPTVLQPAPEGLVIDARDSDEEECSLGSPAEWGIPRSFYVIRPTDPPGPEQILPA